MPFFNTLIYFYKGKCMGIVYKAFKIRIYPNKTQEILINKTIGSCRFIYNSMLAERMKVYEKLKENRRELYEYKYKTEKQYKEEFEWLKEVDSHSLVQSRNDLDSSYQNFFKKKTKFPKFHKKGIKNSYRTQMNNGNIKIKNNKIKLPKMEWINFRDKRELPYGEIKSATISRTATNKYFVSLKIKQELELEGKEISSGTKIKGLDMSLSNFFVDDEGNSPAYEKLFRTNQKRLVFYQKKVSRKKLGSNKRKKSQLKVNKIYEKISNKRKDFTNKLSTKLIKENDVIVVENLNLKAMAQCLNLGKSVNDLGYGMFLQQLQYKALWNNKVVIEADKWFASSKTCSKCGFAHKNLLLGDRIFTCPSCGFEINRNHNAGINLKNYGLNQLGMVRPENKPAENKTSVYENNQASSLKREICCF